MNGVDYSKQLARERENYQNTIQKDRANSEKRIEADQERHDNIQVKQRDVFERDRKELESDYQTNISGIKDRTAESIDKIKDRFHKHNKAEQERFHEERSVSRKDYDGRMREIKNSFDRALRNERAGNESIQESTGKRYDDNVERLTQDKDLKIAKFQEDLASSGSDMRDLYKREKEQLVRAQEGKLQSVYKEESQKRTEMKDRLQKDVKRTQDAYAANTEQTQDYSREKVRRLNDSFNERVGKMAEDYSTKNQNFVEQSALDNKQTNKNHQRDMAEVRNNYERSLRNIDIEKRRRDNGSGEFSEIVRRQQGLKDDGIFEEKIARLKAQKAEEKQNFNKQADKLNEGTRDTLRLQSAEAASRLERKEREMTADKIVNVSNEREKANKQSALQISSQVSERQRYESQIALERNGAKKNVTQLKENFNKSLTDLQERNEKFIVELKQQTTDDKAKFISQSKIESNDQITELRRNFNKLIDTTSGEYESRLDTAQRENSQLREELNAKVSFLMGDADRRVEQQTRMYEDKRQADLRAAQALMDHRQTAFQTKVREVSNSYQQKMDQQTYDSEMRLKQATKEFETQMKVKDAVYAKDMSEKLNLKNEELKRLKLAMDAEKAQLISQYENQINELKRSHKLEQDKLNDYKGMS
jgi:hypothetical protein